MEPDCPWSAAVSEPRNGLARAAGPRPRAPFATYMVCQGTCTAAPFPAPGSWAAPKGRAHDAHAALTMSSTAQGKKTNP